MTPWYGDGQARFYLGDVREVLREMPAGSVDMCVTSPPYWSLRDYGIEPNVWGGDENCAHEWGATVMQQRGGAYTGKTKWQHIASEANEQGIPVRHLDPEAWGLVDGHPAIESGAFCQRCGAWRGCLGLEPAPDLFVAHIVEVFREVRRVLADDGTLWLNIGDSYAGSWGAQGRQGDSGQMASRSVVQARSIDAHPQRASGTGSTANMPGIKPKDLVGIPWLVAFALREDGWWLRQDIIWSKPNPMPESVTDRCTKAHEYLFLLSKRERYYYDQDAIREPAAWPDGSGNTHQVPRQRKGENHNLGGGLHLVGPRETRNRRSVWSIPTSPFPEAHFATFPPALVEPCILAGSREGGTVLDPFLGSGTTALVAKRLGRRVVGIDLNPEYLEMARRRCAQMALLGEPR